jgi:FkbM family methyltransferase
MASLKQIGKKLEWIAREIKLAPKVYRTYGTLYPEWVAIPECGISICINPRERRARKKILFDFIRGKTSRNRQFWIDFVRHMNPDVALDIGTNYGECLFSVEYSNTTRAIGIEANPSLIPILENTSSRHPSSEKILIKNMLASDADACEMELFVDEDWSGTSTAVKAIAEQTEKPSKSVLVKSQRIDDLLKELGLSPKMLLFKLDVEGYEPNVLLGMQEALEKAKHIIGFIEIDSDFLEKAGWTIKEYSNSILNVFDIYLPSPNQKNALIKVENLPDYIQANGIKKLHTDIFITKGYTNADWLPSGWKLANS